MIAIDPVQPQVGDEHELVVFAELDAVLLGAGLLGRQRLAGVLVHIEGLAQLAVRLQFVGRQRAAGVIDRHRHAARRVHHHLVGLGAMRRRLVEESQRAGVRIDVIGADAALISQFTV